MTFAVASKLRASLLAFLLSSGAVWADGLTLNITDTGYDPIPAGGTIAYAIRIDNGGNLRSDADVIEFSIPAGATYVGITGGLQNCSPTPDIAGPATVTCDVPSLAPRGVVSAELLLQPMLAGTITLVGEIIDEAIEVEQATTVTQGADLSLVLGGPTEIQAGALATLTAAITNNGPYPANGATFSMTLPSGFSTDVIRPSGCAISGALISCTIPGPIAVGATVDLDFVTQVVTDNESNIAIAGSIQPVTPPDPDLSNDASGWSIDILPGTDVTLGKSRTPSGLVYIDQVVTFTLTPRFTGHAPLAASITDVVPSNYTVTGVTPTGAGWTCPMPVGNSVSCDYDVALPDAAGYRAPITITAIATTATAPGVPVVNTATITMTGDVLADNNSASDGGADIAAPETDLVARKSGPPHGLVTVGNQYNWEIWTYNQGNVGFQGTLEFTEHVPEGLRVESITVPPGSGWTCALPAPVTGFADILCTTDDYLVTALAVGARTPSLIVTTTVLAEGPISNGLTVGFSGENFPDRDISNNSFSTGVTSGEGPRVANLSLRKSVTSSGPYVSGDPVSFSIEIVNAGDAVAQDVVVLDRLQDLYFADAVTTATTIDSQPSGMVCSVTRGSGFYSDLRCDMATLPVCVAGVSCPVLELTVLAGGDGTKVNTAETYSATTPDPDYSDNSDTASYVVTPRTDVRVEKTASHPHLSTLSAGQQLIYTIAAIVPGNGLSDAEGVQISDRLPAGLRVVSVAASQGACDPVTGIVDGLTTAGSLLVCDLGHINNGSRHSVTVTVVPSTSVMATTITNEVDISTTTANEIDSTNNSDEISHLIGPPTLDLIINKSDSKDPLELSDFTTYSVTVTNAGPSEAFGIEITDVLPTASMQLDAIRPMTPGLTCAPAAGAAIGAIGGRITCDLDHLAVHGTARFEVDMTGTVRGRWTNAVSVTSDEAAYDPQANNSVAETTSVYERADLAVTKTPSAPTVDLMQGFDWTITVENRAGTGIGLAEAVELRDTLPAGMILTGLPVASAGNCDGPIGGREVICILPDMAAGAIVTVTLPVRVTTVTTDPQTFENTATVDTASFDQDLANNASTGSVDVVTTELAGTIWADFNEDDDRDLPQDVGVADVTVNLTGADLLGNTVTRSTRTGASGEYEFDLLPPGTYQVSYVTPSGTVYTVGSALPTGAGGGTASGNQAIAGIAPTTAVPATGKDFTLIPQPQIALAKQVAAQSLQPDGTYRLTYTLRLHNNSLEPLDDLRLNDALQALFGTHVAGAPDPGEYTIVSTSEIGGTGLTLNPAFDGRTDTLLVSDGSLGARAQTSVQVIVSINPPMPRPGLTMALVNTASTGGTGSWSGKTVSDNSNDGATPQPGVQSPTTATLTFNPGIEVTKTADRTALSVPPQPGDVITYDFVVRNSGDTPLQNVTIADPMIDLVWTAQTPIALLAPGDSSPAGSFTAQYTLTVGDIEEGEVENTATGTGKWGEDGGNDLTVSDSDTETVSALAVPGLTVTKARVSHTIQDPTQIGDTIRYSFVVANTGNVEIRNLVLADVLTGIAPDPVGSFSIGTLPRAGQPGASVTLYADYVVTQDDIDMGAVTNTATASGVHRPGDTPIDATSNTIVTPLFPDPRMRVTKLSQTVPTVPQAGNSVTWTITIANTGNTRLDLTNIADPLPNTTVSAPGVTQLDPGASTTATATHVLSQTEIDAGEVQNQVSVTGQVPGSGTPVGPTTSGNDPVTPNTDPTVTLLPAVPSVALLKELVTDVSAPLMPGDEITFRFTIRNTGNVTLDTIVLTDDLAGVILDDAALTGLSLAPGADAVVTGRYALQDADIEAGGLTNTADVTADDPHDTQVTDESGTGFDNNTPTPVTLVRNPAVELVKIVESAPAAPVSAGASVAYRFEVRNIGNVALRDIDLTELVADVVLSGSRSTPLPVGGLDDTSFTATYVLKQTDIDAGIFTNTARVDAVGTGPTGTDVAVSDDGSVDLAITPQPGLAIVKSADASGIANPTVVNDLITYSFTVTNTGTVTLTDVTVADPLPRLDFTAGNTIATLAPGAANAVTLTATYRVAQADIDLGRVDNRASVTGSYFDRTTGSTLTTAPVQSDPVTVPLHRGAAIDLVKWITSTLPATPQVGQEVTYAFRVTNTGNTTLTDVTIDELLIGATVSGGPITLAPGAQDDTTFTARYPLTQTDIERGHLDNRAEATGDWGNGTPGDGGTVTDESGNATGMDEDTRLDIPQVPGIELTKSGSISGFADPAAPVAGDEIRYSFTLRNTGNVTLHNITLADAGLVFDVPGPAPFDLAPGASRTLADIGGHQLSQTQINNGLYRNTATATGEWGDDGTGNPNTVSDDDTVDTPLTPVPGIDLVKLIDTAASQLNDPPRVGDVLHYDFIVTNTGNVTLTDITIADPLTGIVLTGALAELQPGLSDATAFSATYVLTQADVNRGDVTNQATATGIWGTDGSGVPQTVTDLSGTTTGTNGDTVQVLRRDIGLSVVKSADASALRSPPRVGDRIDYSFVITNTGNVTLTDVTLADPLPVTLPVSVIPVLEPGAINAVTLTGSYLVTQDNIHDGEVVNTANVSGVYTDPVTGDVTRPTTPSNTVQVPLVQDPALTVQKTASSALTDPAVVGQEITYTFTVTNTGNVVLQGVTLADPLPGLTPASFTLGDMAPGAVLTRTATYLIVQADIDAGEVRNQAIASGVFDGTTYDQPSGPTPDLPAETVVPVPQNPGLTLVKTADASALTDPAVVGQEIAYSFTVRNTGNVTLRDLVVSDPLTGLAPDSFTIPELRPGTAAVTVGPARYAITQADINAGAVTNRALASAEYGPPGNPGRVDTPSTTDTGVDGPVVTPVSGRPAIALVKTLAPGIDPAALRLGDEVRWSFAVTNTGNVPLTGITVTELRIGATVTGGPISLAPGASDTGSFAARHTVTQADIDAGVIENQAVARGTFDNGTGSPIVVEDDSGTGIGTDDPTRVPLPQRAAIDLVKTVDTSALGTPPAAGDLLTYSFVITNTGEVTLTNVTLTDPMPGLQLTGTPIPVLAPGASDTVSYSASYALTQTDIDGGVSLENQALVTGGYLDGSGVSRDTTDLSGTVAGTDGPTTVTLDRQPGLLIVKTADASGVSPVAQAGDVILYSFALTNTGNVTLESVAVNDPLPGLVLTGNPVASIAPGLTATVTGRYVLTPDDIRATERVNTATATGTWRQPGGPDTPVTSAPSTVTVPLGYPEIDFVITVGELRDLNGDGIMGPGDQVIYRFEVINTGTVPLRGVNIDPTSLSLPMPGLVCTPVDLAVNGRAFLDCTGTAYTITPNDAAQGSVVLEGDATGTSDAGITVRDRSAAPAVTNLAQGGVTLEKLAGVETAMIGDLVPYTIRVGNSALGVPVTARLVDTLPAGFSYRAGSAQLDGVAVDLTESGRRIELNPVTIAPGQVRVLTMQVLVGSSVRPGAHDNHVRLISPLTGLDITAGAKATVRILADAVMQCATVLGRVFDDTDQNGHMSKSAEERGLPNVRLVAPNGLAITTDAHGRFNVPCAALPRAIGSNFMLKLDERTLPAGYRLTTENPRVVRLTPGMITRLDFGATMARLVRIDLAANAFDRGAMRPELEAGLKKMVAEIRKTPTMLRLTYLLAPGESDSEARGHLRLVERALRQLWPNNGQYQLNLETLIQKAGVAK